LGLNFNTSPPTVLAGQITNEVNESCGAISDTNGNLLLYTDGMTIWDRNHQVMPNGTGLLGSYTSSQGGLVIPKPNSPNIYYIFTTGGVGDAEYGLMYTEVDMSLNGGLGDVTANKNVMLSFISNEMISAVHHADDTKVWLVGHRSDEFMSFLISEDGININPVITPIGENLFFIDKMKMSPNGKKLIIGEIVNDVCKIYDFDNESGVISNPIDILSVLPGNDFKWYPDVTFSPNSKYAYVSGAGGGTVKGIYQFEISGSAEDVLNSVELIATSPYSTNELELAPDGKIYFSGSGNMAPIEDGGDLGAGLKKLSVINYPNNKGLTSGVEFNILDLSTGGKFFSTGFPGFIQSYLESGILHEGDCANESVTFSTIRIPGITSITWNFGDTASGANNISTDLTPTHTFATPGTYRVTATIISNGAEQTTETDVIITAPGAVAPQVPALCADANGNAVFNLSQLSTGILNGQDPAVFSVAYFANEADVAANTPIATPDSFTTSGQDIYAQVTNAQTGCKATIHFNLPINPLPRALTTAALEQCGIAGTATFNLTTQDAAILGSQDAGTFKVSYFANAADVQANTHISNPVSFTASAQQVYAIVTNTATGCSSSAITFNLVVTGPAIVAVPLQLKGCSPINLAIVAPQLEPSSNLIFYSNEQDAVEALNAIAEVFAFVGDNAMVYVRAETVSGCADIYKIEVQAGECNIPRGISPNNDGLNDSFDLSAFEVKQLNIYNRYGQQVYSQSNYTHDWHGQADNNNDLPTGTYYYSIEQGGGELKTGWVYVNREIN
jgi:gliding motility-associated-like protein